MSTVLQIALPVLAAGFLGFYLHNNHNMPSEMEEWAKKSAAAAADNRASFAELNKSAFVLGYTGESGKALIQELAKAKVFSKVVLLGRRQVEFEDEDLKNLEQRVIDFDKLDDFADQFQGLDVGFCCLGTTKGKSGKEGFVKVDHDYVVNSAKLAKAGGCQHFHLVSSMGAKQNSWFLYPKTKGQVEEELKGMEFQRLSIYRPGLLLCERQESRPLEKVTQVVMKPIASAFPTAGTMPVTALATAMINSAVSTSDKATETLENKVIHLLAGTLEKRRVDKEVRREQQKADKAEKAKKKAEAGNAKKADEGEKKDEDKEEGRKDDAEKDDAEKEEKQPDNDEKQPEKAAEEAEKKEEEKKE